MAKMVSDAHATVGGRVSDGLGDVEAAVLSRSSSLEAPEPNQIVYKELK
jgi:hypothetical protein